MSYMKCLVEYALQQHGKPATAAALTKDVLALAIDAGASTKVVDSINAKCVSGHLRTLVERGCVRQKGHARDETNRREVPCYVPARGARPVPQPAAPPRHTGGDARRAGAHDAERACAGGHGRSVPAGGS